MHNHQKYRHFCGEAGYSIQILIFSCVTSLSDAFILRNPLKARMSRSIYHDLRKDINKRSIIANLESDYPDLPVTCLRAEKNMNNDGFESFSSEGYQYYDDFGDVFLDDPSLNAIPRNSVMDSLELRMIETRQVESEYDEKLTTNWRRGNWSVRGFALSKEQLPAKKFSTTERADSNKNPFLDSRKEDAISTTGSSQQSDMSAFHVSVVAAPTSASHAGILLPQDKSLPDERTVAVGTTDGSLFIVKIGNHYLTKFTSLPKATANDRDLSANVPNDWIDSKKLKDQIESSKYTLSEEISAKNSEKWNRRHFKILYHFRGSEIGETMHSLIYHDILNEDNITGILCAASGESGEIRMWRLPSYCLDSNHDKPVPAIILNGIHSDKIVSLKTLVLPSLNDDTDECHILISACRDGSVAFWHLKDGGRLMHSCSIIDDRKRVVSLTCLDVSNQSLNDDFLFGYNDGQTGTDMIYLGTTEGYVLGFNIHDLLSNKDCPLPNICFQAHGKDSGRGRALTAIKCGTSMTTSSLSLNVDDISGRKEIVTSVLFTGGEDGLVKQWEIFTQSSSNGTRMDHWPRIPTQKMKQRAHLFHPGHDGAVATLSQQSKTDNTTFLSSGDDGSICVWSTSSGNLLYCMHGFSSRISSLVCLGSDLLVTNGMQEFVCVHDFSVDEELSSDAYVFDT